MHGLLVLDKPGGITSRAALNRIKSWFPRRTKLGHTGTLDPLATGVLAVCVGTATRLAEFVQAMGKSYDSRFRLGATSTSDDADGDVTIHDVKEPPSRAAVVAAIAKFIGTIDQLPPSVSALKVGGRRAHDLARKGESVSLVARPVTIVSIQVHRYEWPFLDVSVECGKGTYIRSIARDLGAALGVGGMVASLRRTRVGPFRAEDGLGLDASIEELQAKLLPPMAAVAGMPQVKIDAAAETRFRQGQTVNSPNIDAAGEVAVLDERGALIGIATNEKGLCPRIVLAKRPG